MNATFVSLAWMLSGVILISWLLVGKSLLGRRAPFPGTRVDSRWLLVPLWLLAGIGGFWGFPLHEVSSTRFADQVQTGPISESTRSELRMPFVVQTVVNARDAQGRLSQSERRSALQLPLVLILFLGGFLFLSRRGGATRKEVGVSRPEGGGEDRLEKGSGSGSALVLLLLLIPLSACSRAAAEDPRPERSFTTVQWDTLFIVESTLEDSLIFRVDRIASDAEGFVILDGVAPRIARFDWDGSLRWYAGRRGGGPGELQTPRDLRQDEDGRSWVLDVTNRRLSAFDASGMLVGEVSLTDMPPALDQFAIGPGDRSFFSVLPEDGALQVVEIGSAGTVRKTAAVPAPEARGVLSLGLGGWIGATPGGHSWTYAFSSGDGLFRFERARPLGRRSLFPDSIPFPEIEEEVTRSGARTSRTRRVVRPTWGAAAVAASGDRIYVLMRDDEGAARLVDVYELDSGGYLETLSLPRSGGSIAVQDGRLLLASNRPHPSVLALALHPSSLGPSNRGTRPGSP